MPLQRLYILVVFKANNSNEGVCDDGEGDDETEADERADTEKVEISNILLEEKTILK